MSAEDEPMLEIDLTELDKILGEWRAEAEEEDGLRRDDSLIENDRLPGDFETWTDYQREDWAWGDHDLGRSEVRFRRRLYGDWLAGHSNAANVGGTGRLANDWLTNSVTPEAWDDTSPTTPPSVCRIDGTVGALFAGGRVSRLFGSSGSAKSWIAKLGTLETLQAGGSVLYLDGDGVWQDFRDHVKALGLARDDALSGRLHYLRVEGSLLGDDFGELLRSQAWTFIVFDGFNVVLNASGFKGA